MHTPSEPFNRVHYPDAYHYPDSDIDDEYQKLDRYFRVHAVRHTKNDTPLYWSMYTHHENVRAHHVHDEISATGKDIDNGDALYNKPIQFDIECVTFVT